MSEAAIAVPHRPPYTVDDLFDMPDDGNRYEVFGGSLRVSPAPAPNHQIAADALGRILWPAVRPHGAMAITGVAVRTSDEDGPVPDLAVTTADTGRLTGALPCTEVHTVVEVVSPSTRLMDRSYKRDLYAEAGIPCYWTVELKHSGAYKGPLPLIVVRLRDGGGWRTIEAAAGAVVELPLAIGRADDGEPRTILVKLDPAELADL
jgi:Uma2 family endonuclease